MKVENMTSANGNKVANQFIITSTLGTFGHAKYGGRWFQSYDSIIVFTPNAPDEKVKLDVNKWDFSKTTGKYRNQFLGETKRETEAKIKSGEYILTDLN